MINLTPIAQQKIPEESRDAMQLAADRLANEIVVAGEGHICVPHDGAIEAALGVAFRLGMLEGIRRYSLSTLPKHLEDKCEALILDQLGVDPKGGVE